MSIIDDRGRVFGRLNLVDAALGLLLIVLVPAAYGAYLLFRDPVPKLTAVLPKTLHQGTNLQVEIHGEHLRPYMRVSFNNIQGRTFLFINATTAIVQMPEQMPADKYDIVLYDYAQEMSRLPAALTIDAPPKPPLVSIEAGGTFMGLTAVQAKQLVVGYKLPEAGDPVAEVLAVEPPTSMALRIKTGDKTTMSIPLDDVLQVPAHVRTRCFLDLGPDGQYRCTIGGVALVPDANVQFNGLGANLIFRISDVHYAGLSHTATVHVRFEASPEVRARMKVADQDVGAKSSPAGLMATVMSLADRGEAPAGGRDDRVRQPIPGRAVVVDAAIKVPIEETMLGWMYKGTLLKAGAPFTFETTTYTVDGGVTDISVDADAPKAGTKPLPAR